MPDAAAVSDAFALGHPLGPLRSHAHGSARSYALTTTEGRFFVKRLPDGDDALFAAAMAFEERVAAAGIEIPFPVPPAPGRAAFGLAARVDGAGLVRVYDWVDGRASRPDDDLAEWLGTTLARIHAIQTTGAPDPTPYGIFPAAEWAKWAIAGTERGLAWAPALRRRMDDVGAATAWVRGALSAATDPVLAHRDVEPWNVLITERGPVLVDWDTAGPDSAGLVVGHAAFAFGAARAGERLPDRSTVRRTLAAYLAAGGGPLPAERHLFARRAGMMLNRLAERIRATLGRWEPGSAPLADLETRAAQRLEALPAFLGALLGDVRVSPP